LDHKEYTERLLRLQSQSWKQKLGFANPYAVHLRRVAAGATLEVGCGIGRVLNFAPDRMVGVDLNAESVRVCRQRGLQAYLPDEFMQRFDGQRPFQTMILSHVVEHMSLQDAIDLVQAYLPYLQDDARLVLIAPQERGFASDPTHVEFMDFPKLAQICAGAGFKVAKSYSFPFVRALGTNFIYNEFVTIGQR
jgi:hypothetical protein